MLVLLAPLPAVASGMIRVAILPDVKRVEIIGADIEVSDASVTACERCERCERCGGFRTDIVRAVANGTTIEVDGRRAVSFRLRSDRPIRLNGREYAGEFELVRTGQGLAVVNELPLEDYLVGVLRAEASDR